MALIRGSWLHRNLMCTLKSFLTLRIFLQAGDTLLGLLYIYISKYIFLNSVWQLTSFFFSMLSSYFVINHYKKAVGTSNILPGDLLSQIHTISVLFWYVTNYSKAESLITTTTINSCCIQLDSYPWATRCHLGAAQVEQKDPAWRKSNLLCCKRTKVDGAGPVKA